MAEPGDVVFTINQALADEEEALRRVQAIAIRRFLEQVLENRKRLGMSVPRGNLSANDHLSGRSER